MRKAIAQNELMGDSGPLCEALGGDSNWSDLSDASESEFFICYFPTVHFCAALRAATLLVRDVTFFKKFSSLLDFSGNSMF